jgi:hypothetical protein
MATKVNELSELKAMLLAMSKDLQETRSDVAWLRKQMYESLDLGPKRAVVTMPFTYELGDPSIALSADEWAIVKSGATFEKIGKGVWLDGEFAYWDHWLFDGGIKGKVTLATKVEGETDFEVEQEEKLTVDMVDEFPA